MGGLEVERRIAHVTGAVRGAAQPLESGQKGIGVRLVPLGILGRDHDVEVALHRQHVERQAHRIPALRRDDAQRPAAVLERGQRLLHPVVGSEKIRRVGVVPGAIHRIQLIRMVGRKRVHLLDEGPPHVGYEGVVGKVEAEHRGYRVTVRFADEVNGVDDRSIQIQQYRVEAAP
jgi:hypothetical protein